MQNLAQNIVIDNEKISKTTKKSDRSDRKDRVIYSINVGVVAATLMAVDSLLASVFLPGDSFVWG
ncbi:MAG: hypothetical protein LBK29_00885 [Oscillospiraceae bacterium]|jgi:hypothetical protein|nr:hypothetical protein [Oscillospiraceae bacterium]